MQAVMCDVCLRVSPDVCSIALRQSLKRFEVTLDQGFLLSPRPAFDLPLIGDRIGDAIEMHGIDERHRPAFRRVASEDPLIMLADAGLQVVGPACPDVVAPVDTAKNIEPATS